MIPFRSILLAIAVLFTTCHALKYAAIKEASGSCFPRDSCSVPRDVDKLEQHNCDCGSLCSKYRTCCIDSPFLNHSRVLPKRSTCRTVSDGPTSVFMIDACHRNYDGPTEIRKRCEDDIVDNSDPFLNAPLTNPTSQTTYKSWFCALCNFEKPQSLTMWNVLLECSSLGEFMNVCTENRDFVLNNIMYIKDKGKWGLWSWDKKSDWKFRFLPIIYKLPKPLKPYVQECRPDLVSECSSDWTQADVKRLCKAYMGAVYFPTAAFRNVHCAICNHVKNLTEISCHPVYSSAFRSPTTMSFGLLVDVDLSDGDTVGKNDGCRTGQVYDPFAKKCRTIECPLPGYKLQDGGCVPE